MAAGDVTRNERYADEELQRLMQEWQSKYMPINYEAVNYFKESDPLSFYQKYLGPGSLQTVEDPSGVSREVFAPTSGTVDRSKMPYYNAPSAELGEFLKWGGLGMGLGGLVTGMSPFSGLSDWLSGGAPYEGISGTSSLDSIFGGGSGGGGGGMFDFLDDFTGGGSAFNPNDIYGSIGEQYPGYDNLFTNTNFGQQASNALGEVAPNLSTGVAGGIASASVNPLYASLSGGGGSSFWDGLGSFLKNPLIPGTNITPGNIGAGLLNYLIQEKQAGRLSDAAFQSAMMSNPLMQPQRFPYQSMAGNLMFDPKGYQMSPYAQGQTDLARQAFEANVSKYGPSGTVFDQYLKNYQNILGQDYFKLLDANLMAGGYTMAPSAGSAFGPLMQASAQAGNNAFEGFGRLLSTTPTPQQTQNNPFQNIFNQASKSWTSSV